MDSDDPHDVADAEPSTSTTSASSVSKLKPKKKKYKPGIIYLSSVPDFMPLPKLKLTFAEYGEVDRTYFQPMDKYFNYRKGQMFTEGWVEFRRRNVAKLVAMTLNNTSVGGKKRDPWYSCIWNIKYLPKFTWDDVNADSDLRRQTRRSQLRAEISQAKKHTHFYSANVEHGQTLDKINNKRARGGKEKKYTEFAHVKQRMTEDEHLANKSKRRLEGGDVVDSKRKRVLDVYEQKHNFVMSSIFG